MGVPRRPWSLGPLPGRDLGPEGVRVNAISAGPVRTLAAAGSRASRRCTARSPMSPAASQHHPEDVGKTAPGSAPTSHAVTARSSTWMAASTSWVCRSRGVGAPRTHARAPGLRAAWHHFLQRCARIRVPSSSRATIWGAGVLRRGNDRPGMYLSRRSVSGRGRRGQAEATSDRPDLPVR